MINRNNIISKKGLIIGILLLLGVFFMFILKIKNTTTKPSFTKGILVVNTDKKEYLPGEIVVIQFSEIDPQGKVLCNSNLELEIDGAKTRDVKKSSTCRPDSVTTNPDYYYNFVPKKTGEYEIKLIDLDTKLVAKNKFKVVSQRSLNISRKTATRINPEIETRYAVQLIVTASRDYQGEISDMVPPAFTIPWQGQAKVSDNDNQGKTITWQVNLKAGETKELIYEYSCPRVSMQLYELGMNQEWQIVAAK